MYSETGKLHFLIAWFVIFHWIGVRIYVLFELIVYSNLINLSFAAYFAIRHFSIYRGECHNACMDAFVTSGTTDGRSCYCALCYDHFFLPAFLQYSGCKSHDSFKRGYNEMFEKAYGIPDGLYYYC